MNQAAFFFERVGDATFRPTEHAQGAWSDDEVHFSPLGGLLTHAVLDEADRRGTPGLQLSRISFDILGRLARSEYTVQAQIIRPGRTIELIEATAIAQGRAVAQARGWMLVQSPTEPVAGGLPERLPSPESAPARIMTDVWSGGYIRSLDVRAVGEPAPGRATAWVRSRAALLPEPHDPVAAFLALVDTANGVGAREDPTRWMFPNVDLTVHLYRQPAGPWVGLDTTATFGPRGAGLTSTVLHDERGPVGVANQSLTVRPLHTSR